MGLYSVFKPALGQTHLPQHRDRNGFITSGIVLFVISVLNGSLTSGTGAITLDLLGEIKWSWLPALLVGSFIGGYLGAHLAITQGNAWIKRAYEIVTLLVGLKLVLG